MSKPCAILKMYTQTSVLPIPNYRHIISFAQSDKTYQLDHFYIIVHQKTNNLHLLSLSKLRIYRLPTLYSLQHQTLTDFCVRFLPLLLKCENWTVCHLTVQAVTMNFKFPIMILAKQAVFNMIYVAIMMKIICKSIFEMLFLMVSRKNAMYMLVKACHQIIHQ